MTQRYLDQYFTPEVLAAQHHYYGRSNARTKQQGVDQLGPGEMEFIRNRDSFYMATVTHDQWPYLQHRGGKQGFLRVLGPKLLGFADYKGNRQLISTGNLSGNHRVALFFMDYARRERLKLLGKAQVKDAREHPDLVSSLTDESEKRFVERVFLVDVLSYDWNCPKYITPKYSQSEVDELINSLKNRITQLEKEQPYPS